MTAGPQRGRGRRAQWAGALGMVLLLALPAPAVATDLTTVGPRHGAAGDDGPAGTHERGRRLIVSFTAGTTAAGRAHALHDAGVTPLTRIAAIGSDVAAVTVVRATRAQRERLADDPRVADVEADVPVRADDVVVDDPAWPSQHGVRRIRANEAWEQTTGSADVVIAVVDTGVDPGNPDLAGRLVAGYDFVNRDDDADDDNGHGTAVATIAAAASDTFGIAGICWHCRVMPVKVLDDDGRGFLSDAAAGIAWAVRNGADIINVSLSSSARMDLLDEALAAAEDAGVLVVASAGNVGTKDKQWPAADPRVMGVAALGELDERAEYSSHGDWVDVAAPGCNPSGWLEQAVVRFCGTSSAAPLVSGAAALLASANRRPGGQLRAALQDTAVPVGTGLGDGRIDVLAALRAVPSFRDIAGNVHAGNIEALAAARITVGCDATRFCPRRKVTRGQIATFLDRALDLPDGTHAFTDVPADHPHAEGIGAVAGAGIAEGCGPARFCPAGGLTRAQMATLLQRALDLPDGPPRFRDVPDDHVHARGIRAIAAAGITAGCAPERFCPGATVTRAQMASFLVRALDL